MLNRCRGNFQLFCVALLSLSAPGLLNAQEPPHPILTISGSGSGASTILSTYTESQYTNNFIPHQSPRNDRQQPILRLFHQRSHAGDY
jgi:hypothetical protein